MKIFPDAAGMRKRGIITLILAVVLLSAWYFISLPEPEYVAEEIVHSYWKAVGDGDMDKAQAYLTDNIKYTFFSKDRARIKDNGGLDSVRTIKKRLRAGSADYGVLIELELKYKNGLRYVDKKYLGEESGKWKILGSYCEPPGCSDPFNPFNRP